MNKMLYILIFSTLLFSSSTLDIHSQRVSDSEKSEELAAVKVGDRWGYINKAGDIAINPQFDNAWDFSEGLARVQIGGRPSGYTAGRLVGGKWGYINKAGDIVISPQFDNAWDFSEGLARVGVGYKSGYINKVGEFVINPQFDAARKFFK